MKIFIYLVLIMISINPIYASDYDTNNVKNFIQYMKKEHNYDGDALLQLFSEIKTEERIKKFTHFDEPSWKILRKLGNQTLQSQESLRCR